MNNVAWMRWLKHPVGASGERMFLDLYKQVTGTAGNYQIRNAKNAMMLNIARTQQQIMLLL